MQHRNIANAEEPAEIALAGVNQVPIRHRIGLNFAETLRALRRQDPAVLMVGEIHDVDTAAMAIRAAQTGHLIMSSVHTKFAHATVLRLQQFGISARDLVESVTWIIAWRLLRRLSHQCRQRSSFARDAAAFMPSGPHVCYTAYPQGCGHSVATTWDACVFLS